jgi:uncharacterized membrane protein YdfJ with MMPL/SSD domain
VDFFDRAYGAFPLLLVAVLVVSYFLLLRAFRSVVLPAKAVLMNLLAPSSLNLSRLAEPADQGRVGEERDRRDQRAAQRQCQEAPTRASGT